MPPSPRSLARMPRAGLEPARPLLDPGFLIACFEHGAILEVDMNGKQLRRWDADSNGKKFDGGINDIVVTAAGGAYATAVC